jgi:hypothetical protein
LSRRINSFFWTIDLRSTKEDIILHKLLWHKISPSERQLADAAGVYAVQKKRTRSSVSEDNSG